jgi:hypothetical protein
MNHTGVRSTGSRRQARKERVVHIGDERLGEGDQILEPERLEADRRAERLQLVLNRIRQEVVAGDDGDGDVDEMGRAPHHAQELQAVGDRHPHVRMIACGRTWSASSRPASALMAVATSKPSSFSIRANVSATDRSSSTMRIVFVADSARGLSAGAITAS